MPDRFQLIVYEPIGQKHIGWTNDEYEAREALSSFSQILDAVDRLKVRDWHKGRVFGEAGQGWWKVYEGER